MSRTSAQNKILKNLESSIDSLVDSINALQEATSESVNSVVSLKKSTTSAWTTQELLIKSLTLEAEQHKEGSKVQKKILEQAKKENDKLEKAKEEYYKTIDDTNAANKQRLKALRSKLKDEKTSDEDRKKLEKEYQELYASINESKKKEDKYWKDLEAGGFWGKVSNTLQDNIFGAGASQKGWGENATATLLKGISTTVSKISSTLTNSVNTATDLYKDYLPKIDTRLQGLTSISETNGSYFQTILSKNSSTSLYKTQDYLKSIEELTTKGVAYNLEDRALLQTVADKLVTTFEVTNETLLQYIRISQTDTTMAAMGSESMLTTLFNAMFEDTSYLTDKYDSVSGSLLNASALLGDVNEATKFNFQVQKWLGALYSTGASASLIDTLASSIGALGSGDVSNMSKSLLTLFGASSSGLSISDLTNGITGEEANQLLAGVIASLQSIASSSDNVIKSQYASLLGISVSDLQSVKNLTTSHIATLTGITTDYYKSTSEILDNMDSRLVARTHVSERIQNSVDNAFLKWGLNIAGDSTKYALHYAANAIGEATGINWLSLVVDEVGNIADTFNGISNIGDWWENLTSGGNSILGVLTDLSGSILTAPSVAALLQNSYSAGKITTRGTGFSIPDTFTSGTSYSAAITSSANSDLLTLGTTSTSSPSQFSSISESDTWTISTLAEKLFSAQTAIGVRIKGIDSNAITTLEGAKFNINWSSDFNGNGTSDFAEVLASVRAMG